MANDEAGHRARTAREAEHMGHRALCPGHRRKLIEEEGDTG